VDAGQFLSMMRFEQRGKLEGLLTEEMRPFVREVVHSTQ
jgi:hypothetical protein